MTLICDYCSYKDYADEMILICPQCGGIMHKQQAVQEIPRKTKRQKARELLSKLLHQEELPAEKIFAEAKKLKIGASIVKLAKRDLNIETNRIGGVHGYWAWSLPESQTH